jgi:hypothetical protein
MKAVVLLAIAAVAFPQHIDVPFDPTPSRFGYDNKAPDVDKKGGYLHGQWPLAWPAMANSTGVRAYLRVAYETTSATSAASTFTLICSETNMNPKALADGQNPITKTAGQTAQEGDCEFFPTSTVMYVGAEVQCGTCSKSADFKFSAYIVYTSPTQTSPVRLPFDMIDNSYTWDYAVPVNTWGVAAKVTVPLPNGGSDKLFAKVDIQGTGTAAVQLVYNLGSPAAPDGSTMPLPAPSATTKIVPSVSRKGDYSTGGLTLTPGVWYVSPYVADAGTGGGKAPFDVAYGFGHEPSAAGMLMPSAIITAILALFAYLFA